MKNYKIRSKIKLKDYATKEVNSNAKKELKEIRKKISKLQDIMFADNRYAVLICLQGMDTSGKDSLIREVFKNVNVNGIKVTSFKVPSKIELEHDYLWRHYIALPARGKIGVFNRTHYENVIVTRVHPNYIFAENIPAVKSINDLNDAFYHKRMENINNFENHIVSNGTIVLKFFLNVSKEEQKNRLLRRLNLFEKNWKFSSGDLKERKLWDKYMFCYEDLLNRTSTEKAPWYVIPADDKPTARLLVAKEILAALEQLDIHYPELEEEEKVKIQTYKNELNSENKK